MKRSTLNSLRLYAGLIVWLAPLVAMAAHDQRYLITSADPDATAGATVSFADSDGTELEVTSVEETNEGLAVTVRHPASNSAAGPGRITVAGGDGGIVSVATPAAGPGQDIRVDLDARTALPVPAVTGTRPTAPGSGPSDSTAGWEIGVGYLYQDREIPAIGTSAVISDPGGERFSFMTDDRVEMDGGAARIAYTLPQGLPAWLDRSGISQNLTLAVNASRASGDDSYTGTHTLMPAELSGLVFTDMLSSFTGIGLFPSGVQSTGNLEADTFAAGFGLSWLCQRDLAWDTQFWPFVSLDYRSLDYDLTSRDTFTEPALANLGISVQREQRLEQDSFELGFGADLVKPFNDRFSVSLGLGAVLYQTDAELDSVEQVNCPPCGFGAPQTNRVADDIDAFDVGGMTRLRAQFLAMPNFSIVASAQYNFAVPTAVIGNQDSGNDLLAGMRTHTGIKKTDELGFNLSVNLLFD